MQKVVLFVVAMTVGVWATPVNAQYYYSLQGPIPLTIDSMKVLIKFDFSFSPESYEAIIASIDRIVAVVDDDGVIDDFVCCSLSTGGGYEAFLDSLDTLDGIYLVEPYYLYDGHFPAPVGEIFVVAFDTSLSIHDIDSINADHGVAMDHLIYGFESIYVLRNTDSSGMRVLDLANHYHDLDFVHFAQPEFGMRFKPMNYKLYDYYHTHNAHIKKVIGVFNEKTVWDFAGLQDSIIVAILDDGVEPHEDLPAARLLPGWNFVWHNSNPMPTGKDGHGMGCAGIIGASHTTDSNYAGPPYTFTGIISLNPHVIIDPLRVCEGNDCVLGGTMAAAFNMALYQGAEVISCSWGRPDCMPNCHLDSAILRLYHEGRNGLGTPIIFASGNSGDYFPGMVGYPACSDYVMAVGASHLNDERWYYSQFGAALDVVAPSGDVCLQGDVWTLDRMDYAGYNDWVDTACRVPITWQCPWINQNDMDYDCRFGGTSAACPVVSGIASLLIARNPELTVDEIYDILRYSAVTDLQFGHHVAPPDYEYGYGRVDAFRAMLAITRGDANNDDGINIADAVYIINYVFKGGPAPQPDALTGDADCTGTVDMADAVFIINLIFHGGPEPAICFEY